MSQTVVPPRPVPHLIARAVVAGWLAQAPDGHAVSLAASMAGAGRTVGSQVELDALAWQVTCPQAAAALQDFDADVRAAAARPQLLRVEVARELVDARQVKNGRRCLYLDAELAELRDLPAFGALVGQAVEPSVDDDALTARAVPVGVQVVREDRTLILVAHVGDGVFSSLLGGAAHPHERTRRLECHVRHEAWMSAAKRLVRLRVHALERWPEADFSWLAG